MTNLDYLYDKAAVAKHFGKNHYVERKLHFKILERATVLPHKHLYVNGRWTWGFGGLVDSRNEFIKESFVHYGNGDAYTPTEEIQYSPATVVYLGIFYPVWGHCLTDNLRRLWFLTSDTFKRYFKDCAQIYLPWSDGGGYSLSNRKTSADCSKLRASTLTSCNRLLSRRSLKTSSCPTNRFSLTAAQDFSPKNTAK